MAYNTRSFRALVAGVTALWLFPVSAIADPAQLIVETCWGSDAGTSPTAGQSFTADETGEITAIAMHLQINKPSAGSLVLSIHDGEGYSGTELHSELVDSPHEQGGVTPIVTYTLDSPVPVTSGQVYTIGIMLTEAADGGGFCGVLSDAYAGGSSYFNSTPFAGADAAFLVTITPPGNATPVPALGTIWLAFLGLGLVGLGITARRKMGSIWAG